MFLLVVGVFAWASMGCGEPTSQNTISLTGSSTLAPLALEIGRRFEGLHPGVRVDVQTGGSSRGVRDASENLVDLGMVSRALKQSESGLTSEILALDGICLIVHATNPVPSLSRAQVVTIYTGASRSWSDVAGSGGKGTITVVHKAEGRSTQELFVKFFGLKNSQVRPDMVIGDNQQGIKAVAGDPGALGYVSIGAAEFAVKAGVAIRLLPMSGVEASVASLRRGDFPLARPLNFVYRRPVEGLTKAFLEFARSEEVHDLVERFYFVPPR